MLFIIPVAVMTSIAFYTTGSVVWCFLSVVSILVSLAMLIIHLVSREHQ